MRIEAFPEDIEITLNKLILYDQGSPRMKIISQVEYGTGNSGADLPEIIFIPGAAFAEGKELIF